MKTILSLLIFLTIGSTSQKKQIIIEFQGKTDLEKYDELIWSGMLHFKDMDFENSLSNFQAAFKI